jgi:hypothetical protein
MSPPAAERVRCTAAMVMRSGVRSRVPCEPGDLGKREVILRILRRRLQTKVKFSA